MQTLFNVRKQLQAIGDKTLVFNQAERRELTKILFDKEKIEHVLDGRYSGGFALLVATDRRILLIDKKPFFLTMEDVRYDMISDVMFNNRLLNSSLLIGTFSKSITFMAFSQTKIRNMTSFIQEKVMDSRNGHHAPSDYMQLEPQPTESMGAFGLPIKRPMNRNPYNTPVMITRRASKHF